MPAPSKRISDRIDRSHTLESAARRMAEDAAKGCAAVFGPALEASDRCPDMGLLCRVAGRTLADHRRQLAAADRALVVARQERAIRRQHLDAAAATVRAELVALRRLLKTFFGASEAARLLGLVGTTPREASALFAAARTAIEHLKAPEQRPPAVLDGVSIDLPTLAARLLPATTALASALDDLADQRWREREALTAQRRALASFDRSYGTVARFLEAIFELADRDDLARSVRPGIGRRGRPRSSASSTASTTLDTGVKSLRARLQKAREVLARAFQVWRKADTSQAAARGASKKAKMFPASTATRERKTIRASRQLFSSGNVGERLDVGNRADERRVA